MTSAVWSLVWVTSFLLAEACREETLIVVKDGPEGVVLSAFVEEGSQASKQLKLQDHLSPECGFNLMHCQNLIVRYPSETDRSNRAILFIPLTAALGLIEVTRNNYTADIEFGKIAILRPVEVRCSPSTVFEVQNSIFAICTDQNSSSIYILNIIVDESTLSKSRYTYTNDLTLNLPLGSLNNATNFLHIDYLNYQFIIFGLGRALYSLRPYTFSETRLRDIPSDLCDSLRWLAHKNGLEFWAYCSNYVINYDVGAQDWREAYTLDEIGISFQCLQQRINISVFSTYINVTKGRSVTIRKEGQNFVTGVCVGESVFVYVDQYAGIHKVDLLSLETTAVFQMSCGNNCLPPVAIDDRYLIVRGVQENVVLVLDIFNNSLKKRMEVEGVTAPLVTLLTLPCPQPPSNNIPIGLDETKPSSSSKTPVVVGLIVGLLAVVLYVLFVIAAVIIWKRDSICKKKETILVMPETNHKTELVDFVGPSIGTFNCASKESQETSHRDKSLEVVEDYTGQSISTSEPPSAESSQCGLEHSLLLQGCKYTAGTETSSFTYSKEPI